MTGFESTHSRVAPVGRDVSTDTKVWGWGKESIRYRVDADGGVCPMMYLASIRTNRFRSSLPRRVLAHAVRRPLAPGGVPALLSNAMGR